MRHYNKREKTANWLFKIAGNVPPLKVYISTFQRKNTSIKEVFLSQGEGPFTQSKMFLLEKKQGTMIFYIYADRVCFYGNYL